MGLLHIDINDLEYWSGQPGSKSELPLIISKLIRSTASDIDSLLIPKGKSTYNGGWDGKIVAQHASEFIPQGLSLWEFGTEKGPSGKAEKDYLKRTLDPLGEDISNATFVFVTTRAWKTKNTWINKKLGENKWADIKVIDGDALVEWLSKSAVISQEIARLSGRKINGSLESVSLFWQHWSNGPNNLKISPRLITAGRKKEQNDLLNLLAQSPSVISIKSTTKEESLAFIAGSILNSGENVRETLISKTIIVDSEEDFNVLVHETPLIIIPRFNPGSRTFFAVTKNHHIVLPLGGDDQTGDEALIKLPKLGREEILEGLQELGLKEEQARSLSKETSRNISVIRRRLGFDGTTPEWATRSNYADLLPALITGKWDENREGDRMIISYLAGEPYEKYVQRIIKWLRHNDPPLIHIGSQWRIASPLDAWNYLGQYLSKQQLDLLGESFLVVSADIKPALTLAPEVRYMANFYGKIPDYSHIIREGLAQSMVLISVYGNNYQLPLPGTPDIWVNNFIGILCSKQDENLWKSIDDILPLIAEASPNAFLTSLERFLEQDPETLRKIFESAKSLIHDTFYHTGLLWALEGIAWLPNYLARVIFALFKLHDLDPGVNIQNRPINSIYQILMPWMPQTFASAPERTAVIEAIAERLPDAAWHLCLGLMPSNAMYGSPTYHLRWRHFAQGQESYLTDAEYYDFYTFLLNTALALCNNDSTRLADLLAKMPDIYYHDQKILISYLQNHYKKVKGNKAKLLTAIRGLLHDQQMNYTGRWMISKEDIVTLRMIYDYLTPKGVTASNLWIFDDSWPKFPEGFVKDDGSAQEAYVKKRQAAALKAIYKDNSFDNFLKLIRKVNEYGIFGRTAANIPLKRDEQLKFTLLLASANNKDQFAARQYIFEYERVFGFDKALALYKRLGPDQPDIVKINFLASLRSQFDLWNFVETQSQEIQNAYWALSDANIWDKDITHQEFQIERLIQHNRIFSAIYVVSFNKENHDTELITTLLDKAATTTVTDIKHSDPHHLTRLLEELYQRTNTDQTKLAQLEWAYLDFLTGSRTSLQPRILYKELSREPKFFVDILCFIYQPNDADAAAKEIEGIHPDMVINRTKKAYQLLNKWTVVPGTLKDGDKIVGIDGLFLSSWVTEARKYAAERDRLLQADIFIGKILAQYPEQDERWPPAQIAHIIDTIVSEQMRINFEIGITNKRSFSSRGPFSGGQRERGLAAHFKKLAACNQTKFPVTASILENIATGYLARAKEEDNEALANDLEY